MKQTKKNYESNPFSITFKGLGLLVDYAKTTFIALVVLSVFGTGFNIIGDIADLNFSRDANQNIVIQYEDEQSIDIGNLDNGEVLSIGLFVVGSIVLIFILGVLIATLFSTIIGGTVAAAANSATDKKEITLGQAIRKMSERFGTLYKAILVATARTIGGYLLFIIPGIRAQLRYAALPYIIMSNDKIKYDEALLKSKDLYNGHLMEVFGIMTVGGIIPFVGSSLSASGLSLSYKQIDTYKSSGKETPKTHWLNYLGFILIGALIVFIGLFGLVIYYLVN